MISTPMKRLRLALGLLAAGTMLAPTGAIAQAAQYGASEDAGSALNRHLRTLADQPRNVAALMGAGKAALDLGDPQAALTFFARAEEVVPRDGRVKAGMGSAFVQMEQAQAALKFFSDAASLGVPEGEYAGDRGLAHDLTGNPRRAQADYTLALSRKENDEVRRRLALSLAISGEREKALATIDAQLRRQDRAAWRTRAFVLALCGDSREATKAVEAVMPQQASQMSPFFARLPALTPAQRAMAVHFGHFPNGGQAIQVASAEEYPRSGPASSNAPASSAATGGGRSETPQPSAGPSNASAEAVSAGRGRRTASDGRRAARQAQRVESAPADQPRAEAGTRTASLPGQATRQSPRATDSIADRFGWNERGRGQRPAPQEKAPAQEKSRPTVLAQGQTAATAQRALVAEAPPAQAQVQAPPVQPRVEEARQGTTLAVAAPIVPVPDATAPAAPAVAPVSEGLATAEQQTRAQASAATSLAAAAPVPVPESSAAAAAPAPDFADIAAAIAALPTESSSIASPGQQQAPVALAQADFGAPAAKPSAAARPAPKPVVARPAAEKKAVAEPKKDAKKPEPTKTPAKKDEPKKAAPSAKEAQAKQDEVRKLDTAKKDSQAKKDELKKSDASKKNAQAKKEDSAKKPASKEQSGNKEPSRHWVQVAGGANKAALPKEFTRLQEKAPKLLSGRSGWTTPLRFTNRLLVGPFKTEKEAQAFVNELNKLDFTAFSWTSPAGQEIEKLSLK